MPNALGFPPSAEKERDRVRKKLNPRGRGILAEPALPAQSQPKAITDPQPDTPLSRLGANIRRNAGVIGDFLKQDRTQATRQGIRNVKQGVADLITPEAQGAESLTPTGRIDAPMLSSHSPVQNGVATAPRARIADSGGGKVLTNLAAPDIAGPSSIDGQPVDLADLDGRKVSGTVGGKQFTYFADSSQQAARERKTPSIADLPVGGSPQGGNADYTPWWQQEGAENSGFGMTGKVSRLRSGYDQFRAQGLSHADAVSQAEQKNEVQSGRKPAINAIEAIHRAGQRPSIDAPLSMEDYLAPMNNIRSADGALLALAYAGGAERRGLKRRKDAREQQKLSILSDMEDLDASLKQARIEHYNSLTAENRAKMSSQGQQAQQNMMGKLIGTNEALYKSILQNLKDSPEAAGYSP